MITGDGKALICACCGGEPHSWVTRSDARCWKHLERNPCAVEGCQRTTAAPASGKLSSDEWICPEHWRRYVPARSRERRLYHRHFRRAKRQGWTDDNRIAFWTFWRRLVARVRERASDGLIDEAEINRLMGWNEV